jgi:hypothetical protein
MPKIHKKQTKHHGHHNVTQTVNIKLDDYKRKKRSSKRRRRAPKEEPISMQMRLPPAVIYQSSSVIPYPVYNNKKIQEFNTTPSPLEDIGLTGTASILDVPTKSEQLSEMIEPVAKYEKVTREARNFWLDKLEAPRYESVIAKPSSQSVPLEAMKKPQNLDISKISSEPINNTPLNQPIKIEPLGSEKNIRPLQTSFSSNLASSSSLPIQQPIVPFSEYMGDNRPLSIPSYPIIEQSEKSNMNFKKSSAELSKKYEKSIKEIQAQKEEIIPWGIAPEQAIQENLNFIKPVAFSEISTQTSPKESPVMTSEIRERPLRERPIKEERVSKVSQNSWDYQLMRYNALSMDKDLTLKEVKGKYGKLKDFKSAIDSMA